MKYISKKSFDFLHKLKQNNNRDWFNENKDKYLEIKKQLQIFAAHFFGAVNSFDESLQIPGQKPYLFRIHRDARFAKGNPYKNHYGILLSQGGKPMMHQRPGYYLHLEPGNSFLVLGVWRPESFFLKNIRKNIDENPQEIKKILRNKKINKYFQLRGERVKTAPKGYSRNHPEIDLLRQKDWYLLHNFSDREVLENNFLDTIVGLAEIGYPFQKYLLQRAGK